VSPSSSQPVIAIFASGAQAASCRQAPCSPRNVYPSTARRASSTAWRSTGWAPPMEMRSVTTSARHAAPRCFGDSRTVRLWPSQWGVLLTQSSPHRRLSCTRPIGIVGFRPLGVPISTRGSGPGRGSHPRIRPKTGDQGQPRLLPEDVVSELLQRGLQPCCMVPC